jgi:hypothetical protein
MVEDYWGGGYWGTGYWASGFWGQGGTIVPPPVLTVPSVAGPRRKVPRPFELTLEEIGAAITVIARRRRRARNS